jgi:hypothetical protein
MYVSNIIQNFILYIGFTYMYVSRIIFCMVLVHDYIPNFCMQVLIMYLCLGSSPIFMFPRSHGNISFPQHGKDLKKSKESYLLKGRFLYLCILLRFGNTFGLTTLGAPPSGERTGTENLLYNQTHMW